MQLKDCLESVHMRNKCDLCSSKLASEKLAPGSIVTRHYPPIERGRNIYYENFQEIKICSHCCQRLWAISDCDRNLLFLIHSDFFKRIPAKEYYKRERQYRGHL